MDAAQINDAIAPGTQDLLHYAVDQELHYRTRLQPERLAANA
jgi:hypothetical protein